MATTSPVSSNTSTDVTTPSLVGLRTSQALTTRSVRTCRLKPASSTLIHWAAPGVPRA
jgi:hypothetical protein